jgi:hypothetical protein
MKKTKNGIPPSSLVRSRMKQLLKAYSNSFELNGYIYLHRSDNPQLFRYLDRFGFFKFHRSNKSKQLVAYHQVVLYLHVGWKRFYYGQQYCCKGMLEIHHLNHCTTDNDKDNLWYVTPTENKALATITEVCFNKTTGLYKGMAKFDLDVINLFRDSARPFCKLLYDTLDATSKNFPSWCGWNFFSTLMDNLPYKQAKLIKQLI